MQELYCYIVLLVYVEDFHYTKLNMKELSGSLLYEFSLVGERRVIKDFLSNWAYNFYLY